MQDDVLKKQKKKKKILSGGHVLFCRRLLSACARKKAGNSCNQADEREHAKERATRRRLTAVCDVHLSLVLSADVVGMQAEVMERLGRGATGQSGHI